MIDPAAMLDFFVAAAAAALTDSLPVRGTWVRI